MKEGEAKEIPFGPRTQKLDKCMLENQIAFMSVQLDCRLITNGSEMSLTLEFQANTKLLFPVLMKFFHILSGTI